MSKAFVVGKNEVLSNEMVVFETTWGEYLWEVYPNTEETFREHLVIGFEKTFDHAIRAARNFIRHNQNAVYQAAKVAA